MLFEAADSRLLDHSIADARSAGAMIMPISRQRDTTAGRAVLMAAGGSVVDRHGQPVTDGKPGFDNPSFVAFGAAAPRRR